MYCLLTIEKYSKESIYNVEYMEINFVRNFYFDILVTYFLEIVATKTK